MARVRIVDEPEAMAFGERCFVKKNKKIIKMSRNKSGTIFMGWKQDLSEHSYVKTRKEPKFKSKFKKKKDGAW